MNPLALVAATAQQRQEFLLIFQEIKMKKTALALASSLLLLAACDSSSSGDGSASGSGVGSTAPGTQGDLSTNVGDRVFFELDSSTLNGEAQATLDRQAKWLGQYSNVNIVVEGHADERGTREYNFSLGARRGQAVQDYLASRGIAAGRMRMVSYGKERPVAVCNDISCWSQNRRAVTVLDGGAGS